MKKKTTLRDMLSIELLNLCTSTNNAQRVTLTSSLKFPKEKVDRLTKLATDVYQNVDYGNRLLAFVSELLDAPELKSNKPDRFSLFSVIVFKLDKSGHRQKVEKPLIITHTDNRFFLEANGASGQRTFNYTDEPYLATDEQIVEFINNLTDEQWKTIATSPIFAPLTQALLDREIQLVEPKVKKVKEAEPELAVV